MEDETHPSVFFTIIEGGSIFGKSLLASSDGHTYFYIRDISNARVWRCTGSKTRKGFMLHKNNRSESGIKCSVELHQIGDKFFSDWKEHNHPARPGILEHILFRYELKKHATNDSLKTFTSVLKELGIDSSSLENQDDSNCDTTTRISRYKKRGIAAWYFYRVRRRQRPTEPSALDFEVNVNYLSDNTTESFFRIDLQRKEHRHLIFASDRQLHLLSKAKTFYIKSTCKVLKHLFCQILTVHSFVCLEGDVKMVPLVFVLMSHKKKKDYIEVFKAILGLLPLQPRIKELIICVDVSLLKGIQSLFSEADIRICPFSWWEALRLKIQEIRLWRSFIKKQNVHVVIQKFFALPFIPSVHMTNVFEELYWEASSFPRLKPVIEYVRTTWIENPRLPVSSWSTFGLSVRNKDEVEEWQDTFITKFKYDAKKFYVVIPQLYKEAENIPPGCKIASRGRVKRLQNNDHYCQVKLNKIWDCYQAGKIEPWEMLKKCSMIYCHSYQRCHL